MQRANVRRSNQRAGEEGRRKGVVLGLTIAEIILLILFAVVLAMAGVLVKRQAIIQAEANAKIQSEKVEKSTPLDPAVYQTGLDFRKLFGQKSAQEVWNELNKLQTDFDKLKSEMAKLSNTEVLPPCFRNANGGQVPYIYEIRLKNDGYLLVDTAPEKIKNQLRNEIPGQVPLERVLSTSEFKTATNGYINYGKRNQCKFYVKVYDDSQSGREKIKNQLKVIESNFVWTFILTIKPGAQNPDDLNLFQTNPTIR